MQLSDGKQSQPSTTREGITQNNDENINNGTKVKSDENIQRVEAGAVSDVWDYEEILNVIGFGKTQWILLLISGLMTITSMADQLSIGIIAISAQCEFQMTQSEKGIMMAACPLGIVLSTYIWGYLSDTWGRRTVLVWTMFVTNILQFISMFVTNVWLFNLLNLLMGISLGGTSAAIYPYLGEFNTSKYRAIVINYSTMFVSITAIFVPAISWLVLSYDWSLDISDTFSFKPWRLIILVNLLPGLIGTLMLLAFPESPKLLLAQEKQTEALKALNWVAKFNTCSNVKTLLNSSNIYLKPEELADASLITTTGGCSIISNLWKATVPLFYKPHGLNVTIAITAMFGLFFSSNGMQIWYPEIVNRYSGSSLSGKGYTVCELLDDSFRHEVGNSTESISLTCDNTISTKTYVDSMIMGAAFFIGFSIQGTLLNPLGRKNVLVAALAVGVLCGVLLHIVTNTIGILILFCLYILLPGLSISIMCGALVDLVPTHLRGKVVSLGLTLGRLGVIVASNLIAAMLEPYCNGTFATVTSSMLENPCFGMSLL